MEFWVQIIKDEGDVYYATPSSLIASERIELIKQLCPSLNGIAGEWWHRELATKVEFTDYLTEQMEVKE